MNIHQQIVADVVALSKDAKLGWSVANVTEYPTCTYYGGDTIRTLYKADLGEKRTVLLFEGTRAQWIETLDEIKQCPFVELVLVEEASITSHISADMLDRKFLLDELLCIVQERALLANNFVKMLSSMTKE